jgi:hypothetical protein
MTFNEFLESDEGRRVLNNRQAEVLATYLRRHEVTIWTLKDLYDFEDQHPRYFVHIGEEEKRAGMQNLTMMWNEYERFLSPSGRRIGRHVQRALALLECEARIRAEGSRATDRRDSSSRSPATRQPRQP